LQYAISIVSWEFFFILVSHDGALALDVSQVMRLMFGFFGIFIWAFAATSNTMVSNIIGQGLHDKVTLLIKKIITLSLGSTIAMLLPIQFFAKDLLSIFNQDPAFLNLAIPVFRVVCTAIVLMSVSTVCLNAVTGTGNTKINLMIEVFTIVLYCVYVYTVMEVYNLSIVWGWGSEWVYWLTILTLSALYLNSGHWKKKMNI
jgi:Na+-driven multidrug efflux pump